VSQLCTIRSNFSGWSFAVWFKSYTALTMPPPCSDGAFWYCPGEIALDEGTAELFRHLRRLALGMQRLAGFAVEGLAAEHGRDLVPLVLLGEAGKRTTFQSSCAVT